VVIDLVPAKGHSQGERPHSLSVIAEGWPKDFDDMRRLIPV
jgi:hypothetical protein